MLSRRLAALVTGPVAFFVAGVIDVAVALRLAVGYLWRSRD